MPFPVRRKKLEVIIVSEVSETGTGRLYRISLLVKSTKKWMQTNFIAKDKRIHRPRNLWLPKWKGAERGAASN